MMNAEAVLGNSAVAEIVDRARVEFGRNNLCAVPVKLNALVHRSAGVVKTIVAGRSLFGFSSASRAFSWPFVLPVPGSFRAHFEFLRGLCRPFSGPSRGPCLGAIAVPALALRAFSGPRRDLLGAYSRLCRCLLRASSGPFFGDSSGPSPECCRSLAEASSEPSSKLFSRPPQSFLLLAAPPPRPGALMTPSW